MPVPLPPVTTTDELISRYDLFLVDAYGVLVDTAGAIPGAAAFLNRLKATGKEYLIVSNDASRSIAASVARYRSFGLDVEARDILTSGLLLADHFAAAGLVGARCIVIGTDDSSAFVRDAGGIVVPPDDDSAAVVVMADDDGYPFLETINDVISVLLRRLGRQQPIHLILPNPDLVCPRGEDAFGITSGAIAALIEAVLPLRDPRSHHRFVPLGKPHAPLFAAAARRFPSVDKQRTIMVGDQLVTDVLGARRFGIDAALVLTGVGRLGDLATSEAQPAWTLERL